MLKPAQLYKEQLKRKMLETWYDQRYMYWNGGPGDGIPDLRDNNYDAHSFVSVDKSDNVIGYITYNVDWNSLSAQQFGAISFQIGNVAFAKDLYDTVCDIFEKYHLNRMSWWCFADNPAVSGYRAFIRKHGGRECGYLRQYSRLADGKLHDSVMFEILREEFENANFVNDNPGSVADRRSREAQEKVQGGAAGRD